MYSKIQINDDFNIPYGNMCFVYEKSGDEKLHSLCVDLEQTLKIDYEGFAHKIRKVLEEFVLHEESKRRIIESGMKYNPQTTRERITSEIIKGEKAYGDLLVDLCMASENQDLFKEIIVKHFNLPETISQEVLTSRLKEYILGILLFASKNSHSGEKSQDLTPDDGTCRKYMKMLYNLLSAYYDNTVKYDGGKLPIGDYYPIPKALCREHGVYLPEGKHLYVRQGESNPEFYIFSSADKSIKETQQRDIETIKKLWTDNFDFPQNVIPQSSFISNKNGEDFRFWIYPLPSFPQSLTDDFIDSISNDDKMRLIKGIVRGVASMHNAEPPFYHRSLSPSSFLVCRIKNGIKPFLVNFDCVKDTDSDAAFTVLYAVGEKVENAENPELLFAPELLDDELIDSEDVDWAKVDIFALGKTILKILTNSYNIPSEKPENINSEQFSLIAAMCDESPEKRPDISKISNIF